MHESGSPPESGRVPNQITLDGTVIRIYYLQFWLYAAVGSETSDPLHVRLFSTTTTALTEIFLREVREKHNVYDSIFLVSGAKHLQTVLHRSDLRFQVCHRTNF